MEEFVPYELAVKLKEKGFNWICSHYYRTNDKKLFMIFPSEDWSYIEERINAPTILQVLKWLREKHEIHIEISIINHDDRILWTWCIYDIESGDIRPYNGSAESFEKSVLAGIEYVLDNLI